MIKLLAYLKDYKYENIRIKIFILYLLNIIDLVFTVYLLNTGYFIEVNPIILHIIRDDKLLVIFKIILPFVLLLYICFRIRFATKSQLYISNRIINIAQLFYSLLNISHLIWIIVFEFNISIKDIFILCYKVI